MCGQRAGSIQRYRRTYFHGVLPFCGKRSAVSARQCRMRGGNPVLACMEDQRLCAAVPVLFDLANEDQVVTALVLGDVAAHQHCHHVVQHWGSRLAIGMSYTGELVSCCPCELL